MRNFKKMNGDEITDAQKARYWDAKRSRPPKPTRLEILIARVISTVLPPMFSKAPYDPGKRSRASNHHRAWKRRRAAGWSK